MFCCNPDPVADLIAQTKREYDERMADLVQQDVEDHLAHGSCDACQSSDHTGLFVDGPDRVCEGCLMLELDD